MKKILTKWIIFLVFISLILLIIINTMLKVNTEHLQLKNISKDYFWQIISLSNQCQLDIENVKYDFSLTCLRHAEAAAYIIQNQPNIINNPQKLKKIAKILHVDEIHLFNEEGVIFSGTHPKYYQFTLNSGEQISYFLPMLKDKSLKLAQEIELNTAENKPMQYAAAWTEDKKILVQVGTNPKRVLQEIDEKSLSWVLTLIPLERESQLFIINNETGKIETTTYTNYLNNDASILDINCNEIEEDEILLSHPLINSEKNCVVYQKKDNFTFARSYPSHYYISELLHDTGFLIVYIILLASIALVFLLRFMDRKLIQGLQSINNSMRQIENGTLDRIQDNTKIPELSTLTLSINQMLLTIRIALHKFLFAVEKSKLPIGIYEYSIYKDNVFISAKVWDIILLPYIQDEPITQSKKRIQARLDEIKQNIHDKKENVYTLTENNITHFIQIEEISSDRNHAILVVDVTREWIEKEALKQQRDSDILTNLYNRRAFTEKVNTLLTTQKNTLKFSAIIMIDADKLKFVNDNYGHLEGDRYLNAIAKTIVHFLGKNAICARLGGDEFSAFIYGANTKEELIERINLLTQNNDKHYLPINNTNKILIKFSMGYSIYPEEGEELSNLMRLADEKMYENKRQRHSER